MHDTTPPSRMRHALGTARIAVGAFLLFTLVFQIVDLQVHGSLVPDEYFTYFTVESTMLNIVLLVLGGLSARRRDRDGFWLTAASAAIVPYAIVTFLVYNVMLRGLPAEKYLGMDWHNEVVHVVIPLYLALDWFVLRLSDDGRPRLGFRALGVVFAFPVLWIAFTMVRGALSGYYPYPFLDVNGPGGAGSVAIWAAGLTAFILLLGAAAIAVTRVRARRRHAPRLAA